jgi:hypothetical protein
VPTFVMMALTFTGASSNGSTGTKAPAGRDQDLADGHERPETLVDRYGSNVLPY